MKAAHASLLIVVMVIGAAFGLGSCTFAYARAVAMCNDCHVPHGVVARYATKARNGLWHSVPTSRLAVSPSQSGRCRQAGRWEVTAVGTAAIASIVAESRLKKIRG